MTYDCPLWIDGLDSGIANRFTHTAYTNVAVTKGVAIKSGTELIFDGATSYITGGNVGTIYTINFWVKTNGGSQNLIDMDGTNNIDISSGTVRANNWTSPTIYVNAAVSSTIADAAWSMITVTSATGSATSTNTIGKISAGFYTGSMTRIQYFTKVLTATQIGQIYGMEK